MAMGLINAHLILAVPRDAAPQRLPDRQLGARLPDNLVIETPAGARSERSGLVLVALFMVPSGRGVSFSIPDLTHPLIRTVSTQRGGHLMSTPLR